MEEEVNLVDVPLITIKKSYVSEYPPITVLYRRNIDNLTDKEKGYLYSVIRQLEEDLRRSING